MLYYSSVSPEELSLLNGNPSVIINCINISHPVLYLEVQQYISVHELC